MIPLMTAAARPCLDTIFFPIFFGSAHSRMEIPVPFSPTFYHGFIADFGSGRPPVKAAMSRP
jgi:hypothetical protein